MSLLILDEIKEFLKEKPDHELISIWTSNNRMKWSNSAFEAIKQILQDRGVPIPAQNPPLNFPGSEIKEKLWKRKSDNAIWVAIIIYSFAERPLEDYFGISGILSTVIITSLFFLPAFWFSPIPSNIFRKLVFWWVTICLLIIWAGPKILHSSLPVTPNVLVYLVPALILLLFIYYFQRTRTLRKKND